MLLAKALLRQLLALYNIYIDTDMSIVSLYIYREREAIYVECIERCVCSYAPHIEVCVLLLEYI